MACVHVQTHLESMLDMHTFCSVLPGFIFSIPTDISRMSYIIGAVPNSIALIIFPHFSHERQLPLIT